MQPRRQRDGQMIKGRGQFYVIGKSIRDSKPGRGVQRTGAKADQGLNGACLVLFRRTTMAAPNSRVAMPRLNSRSCKPKPVNNSSETKLFVGASLPRDGRAARRCEYFLDRRVGDARRAPLPAG